VVNVKVKFCLGQQRFKVIQEARVTGAKTSFGGTRSRDDVGLDHNYTFKHHLDKNHNLDHDLRLERKSHIHSY
jgi:hypothetical protein